MNKYIDLVCEYELTQTSKLKLKFTRRTWKL